jgi:hypothetical protein
LRRISPDRGNRISPPHHGGEGHYSLLMVRAHPRNEEEGLQGGVARAKRLRTE